MFIVFLLKNQCLLFEIEERLTTIAHQEDVKEDYKNIEDVILYSLEKNVGKNKEGLDCTGNFKKKWDKEEFEKVPLKKNRSIQMVGQRKE